MALNNYANLKQAVENWSHRTDISGVMDDFIDLAESRIDNRLQLRGNEQRATATTSGRFLALPDYFLEMRRLSVISGAQTYEVHYKAPEQMTIVSASGRPRYYTVTSQLEFDRVPDSSYTMEMSYYRTLAPLDDTTTTNDVLTFYPDLYLYGCLAELYRWAMNEERAVYFDTLFDSKIVEAQKQEGRGRHGPAPAMRVEGSTP